MHFTGWAFKGGNVSAHVYFMDYTADCNYARPLTRQSKEQSCSKFQLTHMKKG